MTLRQSSEDDSVLFLKLNSLLSYILIPHEHHGYKSKPLKEILEIIPNKEKFLRDLLEKNSYKRNMFTMHEIQLFSKRFVDTDETTSIEATIVRLDSPKRKSVLIAFVISNAIINDTNFDEDITIEYLNRIKKPYNKIHYQEVYLVNLCLSSSSQYLNSKNLVKEGVLIRSVPWCLFNEVLIKYIVAGRKFKINKSNAEGNTDFQLFHHYGFNIFFLLNHIYRMKYQK